jgi:hypothetical protein
LGTWLGGGGEGVLREPFCDRVHVPRISGLGGVALRFFLLEVAPVAAFPLAAVAHAVRRERRIGAVFETVDNVIEGAHGRGVEGFKASNLGEAWMSPQVTGPPGLAFIVEQQHQKQGSQHAEGIIGGPAAGAWGIEGVEQGLCRIEVEPQEDQGGVAPGLREMTRLTA